MSLTKHALKQLFGSEANILEVLSRFASSTLVTDNGCGATYIGSGNGGHYIVSARHCGQPTSMTIPGTTITIAVEPVFTEQPSDEWFNGRDIQLFRVADSSIELLQQEVKPVPLSTNPERDDGIVIIAPTFHEAEGTHIGFVGSPEDTDAFLRGDLPEAAPSAWPTITSDYAPADQSLAKPGYSGGLWADKHGLVGIHSYGADAYSQSAGNLKSNSAASVGALKSMLQGLGIRDYGLTSFSEFQNVRPRTQAELEALRAE